jgi:hypothetical protein
MVGKAKIMSYEDIQKEQKKRAEERGRWDRPKRAQAEELCAESLAKEKVTCGGNCGGIFRDSKHLEWETTVQSFDFMHRKDGLCCLGALLVFFRCAE